MAAAFDVSPAFLDQEVADLIVAGRLNAKIDKVAGIIETNRPDHKNALYQVRASLHWVARRGLRCHWAARRLGAGVLRVPDPEDSSTDNHLVPLPTPQDMIKKGDALLNRVQKLSKIIDIE